MLKVLYKDQGDVRAQYCVKNGKTKNVDLSNLKALILQTIIQMWLK